MKPIAVVGIAGPGDPFANPEGKWFGEVDEEKLDAILDTIEDGEDTSEYELD